MSMKVAIIFGTRPEGIKMAPLIKAFSEDSFFEMVTISTGQHKSMLDQVLGFFDIQTDYDLALMKDNQSLNEISSRCIQAVDSVLQKEQPDLVFVQGDTTTAFASAFTSFNRGITVAHLEAGLRSGDLFSPFPEEANRKLISQIASYHFAPTNASAESLKKEGIVKGVFTVGNSVIDSLFFGLKRLQDRGVDFFENYPGVNFQEKVVLITAHRRESFGKPFEDFVDTVVALSEVYSDVHFLYPVHLNPNVRKIVFERLENHDNITLTDPVGYSELIWLLDQSWLIMTDSGGIQEEAPSLGKPILVLRDVTERMEGVAEGTARLVGMNPQNIKAEFDKLYNNIDSTYTKMSQAKNPYGDGDTCKRILKVLKQNA